MKNIIRWKPAPLIAMITWSILTASCVIPSQQNVKEPEPQVRDSSGNAQSGKLLKPTIQDQIAPSGAGDSDSPTPVIPPTEPALQNVPTPEPAKPPAQAITPAPLTEPQSTAPPAPSSRKREPTEWEDQKVRSAALEFTKDLPGVEKIKICYSVKDDEWWVMLYDVSGPMVDLKQYTWNRNQEKLESFLVVKRIPVSRLNQSLQEDETGKACEIVDPPASNPLPVEPKF